MLRYAALLLTLLVALPTIAQAASIATFAPPIAWSLPGTQKLAIADKPDGGPGGKAWAEVTYSPGAFGNFRSPQPLSLPPGTLLKVWV